MATTNYNFTELDPDGKIDIAGDVNKALGEIDTSLKAVADAGSQGGSDINAKNGAENGSLILNNMLNTSSGQYSTAAGSGTQATEFGAFAEGYQTNATGIYSHAEGYRTTASEECSHAEGVNSKATKRFSHAEGVKTTSEGDGSHSEGYDTHAYGSYSHVEGSSCSANGLCSHVEGAYNKCEQGYCHVSGKYSINTPAKSGYLEVVGNGTDVDKRSNARTLKDDGTGWYANDVTCGDTDAAPAYSLKTIGDIVKALPSIDFGVSNSLQVPANSNITADITFGSAKSDVPNVYCQVHSTVRVSCSVEQVTNSQASIKIYNDTNSDADAVTIDWLAISGR